MNDRDFVAAFEACTLPATSFHHREHVRLAWIYLREQELIDVLPRFASGLRRFAASLGHAGLYHETITWAYLFLIHERMQRSAAETFEEFAEANGDLFGKVLSDYYESATLSSDLARRTFVMPDRSRL